MMPELRHMTYEDRQRALRLTTLEARRKGGGVIQQYKNHSNMDKVTFTTEQKTAMYAIPPEQRPTSMAAGAYKNKYAIRGDRLMPKTTTRHNFYTNRIVSSWNALENKAIGSNVINSFKNNIG